MQLSGLYFNVSAQVLLIVVLISTVVWLGGVWLSLKKSGENILIKSLLWLFCVLSANALMLQPQYDKKQKVATAVLFTNQLEIDQFDIDFWLNKNYTFFKLPHLKSNFSDSTLIKTVANAEHLVQHHQPIDSLFIIGENLSINALKNLPLLPVHFIPSKVKNTLSLIDIKYPEKININENFDLFVELEVDSSIQKFVLQSPFSKIDTIGIAENVIEIEYKVTCSLPGNHLVQLHFLDIKDNAIETLSLPIEVIPKTKIHILMINGHPDFEHKHLKNWIAKQGHELSVRTKISLQNFKYDRINQNQKNTTFAINETFLKQIDLLIIDGAALLDLAENEYELIKRFHKKGMDMLLRTDENMLKAKRKWGDFQFKIESIAESKRLFANININNKPVEVEIYPHQNNLYTAKRFKGKDAGKILSTNRNVNRLLGITNLQNSYLFNLKGDTAIYNNLWFGIIDEMSGAQNILENSWQFKKPFPQSQKAMDIILLSNEQQPKAFIKMPEANINDWSPLYLQQHYLISEKYEATFWAKESGWYQFKTEKDDTPTKLYIAGKKENNTIINHYDNLLKSKYIDQIQKRVPSNYKAQNIYTKKPITPIWNWLIFVICLSAIWILEKFIDT